MIYAKKKFGRRVQAYELGGGSEVEAELLRAGKIILNGDGSYSLFSSEAINGAGEIAARGDFFKVDSNGAPYPNKRAWFLENHRQIFGDEYEQIPKAVKIWRAGDEICAEIEFLFRTKKLWIDAENNARYFNAFVWGANLSAAKNAVVVFYSVQRDESGEIIDEDFGLVEGKIFAQDYEIFSAQ